MNTNLLLLNQLLKIVLLYFTFKHLENAVNTRHLQPLTEGLCRYKTYTREFPYASGAEIPYETSLSDPMPPLYDIKSTIWELHQQASEFSTTLIEIEEEMKPDIQTLDADLASKQCNVM